MLLFIKGDDECVLWLPMTIAFTAFSPGLYAVQVGDPELRCRFGLDPVASEVHHSTISSLSLISPGELPVVVRHEYASSELRTSA